jgi:hypothetical protein
VYGEAQLTIYISVCSFGHAGRLQDYIGQLQENIQQSFMPRKEDVTDDYWEWLRWRLGQVRKAGKHCIMGL